MRDEKGQKEMDEATDPTGTKSACGPTHSLVPSRLRRSPRLQDLLKPPHNIDLPYGLWVLHDGSEVLFDRLYRPMLARDASGGNVRAIAYCWVKWRSEGWFWSNGRRGFPMRRKATSTSRARQHGEAVLAAFRAGEPMDHLIRDRR